jgi:hypothetical protein
LKAQRRKKRLSRAGRRRGFERIIRRRGSERIRRASRRRARGR